ncbi:MAG: 50S ribosomal protein L23 [Victivallaceae bacterium]|nr:50S ribosomal protein L23 [Victivallaceae bacterium]
MKNAYSIILAPVVSEKNQMLGTKGKYVFKVAPDSEKIEIGRAVEQLFNVKVASVNIMIVGGKAKRMGRSIKQGRRPDWKKAIVTLSEGSIELF